MLGRVMNCLEQVFIHDEFTVNRILIMDAAGNGVKTLRELSDSDSDYYYITMLDSNQFNEERIYREKSTVEDGERKLSEHDAKLLKVIQKEINSLKRTRRRFTVWMWN